MMKRAKTTSGFTLMELLLSIGLLAMLLAGMYQILDSWMQRAVNRIAAADMMRVQNAAQDYVLANFEPLKTEPINVFVEMDIEDLKEGNYLPAGYQPRNTFRQRIRVFRRNLEVERLNPDGTVSLDVNGDPAVIITIEVVTVSDNPAGAVIRVANQRLRDTAQAGGPRMGIISNMVAPGMTYTGLATSPYNEWYVPLSELQSAGYTASPDSIGGYLAAYGLVNAEATDVNDKWLYRVTIDNRPELNRMATNLNMNSHRVENVGTMIADRMNVTGNAAFRGVAQGVTSETAQAMTVEQALRIDTANEARINMRDNSGACTFTDVGGGNRTISGGGCNIAGGELQVVSGADNAIMTIGTLTADGSVITDFTNVDNTTDSRGISTFENVTGQDMNISTTALAPLVTVTGPTVETIQMQTATMGLAGNANIGSSGETTIKLVAAQVNTGSVSGGHARTFRSSQLDLGNAAEVTNEIRANALDATDTLYLTSVDPAGYNDAYLNRTVVCTPYNGRTYCEPNGVTTWYGGDFRESCTITGTGYQCNHFRLVGGVYQYYGQCTHTRSVGASGQAYHASNCTP